MTATTGPAGLPRFEVYGNMAITNGGTFPAAPGVGIRVPMNYFGNSSDNIKYHTGTNDDDPVITVPDTGIYEVTWYLTCATDSNNVSVEVKIGQNGIYSEQLTVVKNMKSNQEVTFMGSTFAAVNANTTFDMVITSQYNYILITIPTGGTNAFLSVKKIDEWSEKQPG